MFLAVLSAFAAALFAPWVYRMSGRVWQDGCSPPCLLGWRYTSPVSSLLSYPVTFLVFVYDWAPSLGIRFSFFSTG